MMVSKRQFDGERVKLGELISSYSERNRTLQCTDVYSVTNSVGFTPSEEYFSKEVFSKDLKTYRLVKEGMIAYNPSRINVGSIALQDQLPEVVVSPLYVVFKTDESRLLPRFALSFLKSKPGLDQIAFQSIGTVRNNLKFDALCRIEINLPPVQQQQPCIELLERITAHIALLRRYCDLCDNLVKSRFVEMFGDPQAPSKSWPLKSLGDTCEIVTGNTPSRKDPTNYGDHIEWIKTDNISGDKYLTRAVECLSESGVSKGRTAPTGSVLMACIAGSIKSIGKVAVADRPVAFNQQINALIPQDDVLTDYLYWALKLSKSYLCSNVNMQLKGILNKTTLSAKELSVPPLPLQQQFADFVAKVDKPRFVGIDLPFQTVSMPVSCRAIIACLSVTESLRVVSCVQPAPFASLTLAASHAA